jgi:hypothetical protein
MTDEEFQSLVLSELKSIRGEMATKNDIVRLENKIDTLAFITQEDVKGILEHVKDKTELLPQIDERLENIEDDLNYLARKSAKYGTEIVKLKKTYKKHL